MTTTLHVPVDGARLAVAASGPEDAPAVLLLHGALSSSRAMLGIAAALRARWRCYAVDQRGHGRSTRFGEPGNGWERFDAATLVADARVLLDALRPAALVGASMGGMVAALAAARSPADVRALALLSTAPRPSPRRAAFFARLTPESFDAETRRLFDHWHGADYWPALARAVSREYRLPREEAYAGERLAAYRAPALVLQGEDDPLVEADEARLWTRWMPQAEVRLLPGGHAFFAEEARAETHEALKGFLERAMGLDGQKG